MWSSDIVHMLKLHELIYIDVVLPAPIKDPDNAIDQFDRRTIRLYVRVCFKALETVRLFIAFTAFIAGAACHWHTLSVRFKGFRKLAVA